jgi:transcription elongation factor GreA
MADQIMLTQSKYDEMTARLKYLETEKRAEIALAIKTAKEFGDLSENSEYAAAKDEQASIETEIASLTETLSKAVIIDESTISTKQISLGNLVKVLEVEYDEEVEYRIVSSAEADSASGKISEKSPIGKALIGKKKGDTTEAVTPGGTLKLKILNISK